MKLVHPLHEFQIGFNEGDITALFFDSPVLFRSFVTELFSQYNENGGNFVLSEENNELKLSDNIIIIPNSLCITFDDKKVSNKLSSMLKSYLVSEDMFMSTQEIISKLEMYAEEIVCSFQYPLCYEKPDSSVILKILGFKAAVEYQSELEKLLEYMNLHHDICNIRGFVLLNCFSYFSIEELQLLAKDCQLQGHSLLFIESSSILSDLPLDFCRKIIIDWDGVEIF